MDGRCALHPVHTFVPEGKYLRRLHRDTKEGPVLEEDYIGAAPSRAIPAEKVVPLAKPEVQRIVQPEVRVVLDRPARAAAYTAFVVSVTNLVWGVFGG